MGAPFATAGELIALHPELADEAPSRVDAALAYVSAAIAAMCDADSIDSDVLSLVAIQASARMLQADDSAGVSQQSWGASPFSGSVTYANPSGDVYFTAFERKLLGIEGADMEAAFVTPGQDHEEEGEA